MGLGSFLEETVKDFTDPGDLIGGLSGETGRKAATSAAEITNAELMRQFELSQENLRPFLEAAQRQLPGIEQQLSPGGFEETIGALTPELEQFLAPIEGNKLSAAQSQLDLAGLGGQIPGAANEAAAIDPALFNQLLLGSEADLFGNRLALSGIGEGAGTVLSNLGQRTGAGIAHSNIDAQLAAQQAKSQGTSNAFGIAGLGASFFSDERLKENIEELGNYKGLRIIRWNWKEFVPEYWKGINFGFSAQDVLDKYPKFVSNRRGFLSIDRDGLINHLESI